MCGQVRLYKKKKLHIDLLCRSLPSSFEWRARIPASLLKAHLRRRIMLIVLCTYLIETSPANFKRGVKIGASKLILLACGRFQEIFAIEVRVRALRIIENLRWTYASASEKPTQRELFCIEDGRDDDVIAWEGSFDSLRGVSCKRHQRDVWRCHRAATIKTMGRAWIYAIFVLVGSDFLVNYSIIGLAVGLVGAYLT